MSHESLRIWRSPYSNFYRDETLHAAEVYTLDYLRELRRAGFNAIWIRGILRDIVRTRAFPELGANSAAHLRSLRTVIQRGESAGIRTVLYMQEPMGMPARAQFWRQHPEARGVTEEFFIMGRWSAMCTSEPRVRAFLREGAQALSARLPGLAGVILITASEYPTHCYSRYRYADAPGVTDGELGEGAPRAPLGCARCRERHPREIVSEIIRDISGGLQEAGNGAWVIAWNWSWSLYEPEPQEAIIQSLPRGVTLLLDFERGDTKVILGKRRIVDEYSLSFAGPSRRFLGSFQAARRRGMEVMAKLQFGTTHELATVPNLALIGSLYEKARAMRRLGVAGFMGCWNFGNMLTANTAAFLHFMTLDRLPPRKAALERFARRYFPGCDAPEVVRAWEQFARAMDAYPFCIPFLYYSPMNYAVAHPIEPRPLDSRPVGPAWLPAKRGDELKESFGCYTLPEIITGLGIVTRRWWDGVRRLEAGLAPCDGTSAREEMDTARVAGHCFQSGWNLYRAYPLRRNWSASKRRALLAIACSERKHLAELLPILISDRRMGFHSECQLYMFSASAVRRKLRRLNELLGQHAQ